LVAFHPQSLSFTRSAVDKYGGRYKLDLMSNAQTQTKTTSARDEIAAAVRAHFAVRSLSDTAAARLINKSQSWMSRRTTGETPIDADELGLIADALGITYVDLVQLPKFMPTAPLPSARVTEIDPTKNAERPLSDYSDDHLADIVPLFGATA
jgi:hypothetical protein